MTKSWPFTIESSRTLEPMPKIKYRRQKRFMSPQTQKVIVEAEAIIETYAAQGFDLTLRQLYYQFVARGLIENSEREYKRIGRVINDARMCGLIDWYHITDRTRFLRGLSHWSDPSEIVAASAAGFHIDRWEGQSYRPEVWIEKDALVGVISSVCNEYDVPFFSCRGYTSQSEMWRAAQRLAGYTEESVVIHLGDLDPSGVDMSRDIEDRLEVFGNGARVERIALNEDQIEQYDPPPNPAKLTDSRSASYVCQFGYDSWELDALEPSVIAELVRSTIEQYIDAERWVERAGLEDKHRKTLSKVSAQWPDIVERLKEDE